MTTLTMVTVYASKRTSKGFEGITGFGFISSDYKTMTMSLAQTIEVIKSKKAVITNLGLENGKVVATNGAMNRYSMVNTTTGMPDGEQMAVVLNRVEENGKLAYYTVFMQDCTVREVGIREAVAMCKGNVLSNGKIKHTNDGDIVSSIAGSFILRQIEPTKAPTEETMISIMYFETMAGGPSYFGGVITSKSAVQITNMRDKLETSNLALIKDCEKAGKQNAKAVFGIQRMSENSFFGAFPLSVLDKLISAKEIKFICNGEILVSVTDAKAEKSPSILALNNKLEVAGVKQKPESAAEGERVKDFASKIASKYKELVERFAASKK